MKLKRISITNFKSIKSLELHVTDNLYCLIGKNEVGKSNILQAIASLGRLPDPVDLPAKEKIQRTLAGATIVADFEPSEKEQNSIYEALGNVRVKFSNHSNSLLLKNGVFRPRDISLVRVTAKRNLESANECVIILKTDAAITPDADTAAESITFHNKLAEQLPNILYFEKEEFLLKPVTGEELAKPSYNPSSFPFKMLLSLGGVTDFKQLASAHVEDIIHIRESVATNVNKLLRKYYKQDQSLSIRLESHNSHFTLHFTDEYHRLSSLTDRSAGFQYFFAFLINKIYLKEFGKKDSIYLFDEPALSLHPTGQKDFLKLLEEIAVKNQIIYTTHSPFSINRMKPTRVWVIEKSVEKGTLLNPKPYQKNWRPLRSALGIDISDSFFYGDRSLLVEGPEDKLYIGALINYFSSRGVITLNSDLLSIIDAGAISNMPAMVQILLDEQRPILVFMDDDDEGVYNRLKKKDVQVLRVSDISDKAVSIEDLMPHEMYTQALVNYLEFLVKDGTIVLTKEIRLNKSIDGPKKYQQMAKAVITSFQNSDGTPLDAKNPISKVGIAHEFEKLLAQTDHLGTEAEEAICLELVKKIVSNLQL